MTAIHVFDPAMCCSTGICGPSVEPELVRFAADLDWLKSQGVAVERFNLSQQPAAFVEDPAAKAALEAKGEAGLPLIKVNGELKSSGVYPSRDELATWAGVGATAQNEKDPSDRTVGEVADPHLSRPSDEQKKSGCC